jgi:hypothetical protein
MSTRPEIESAQRWIDYSENLVAAHNDDLHGDGLGYSKTPRCVVARIVNSR